VHFNNLIPRLQHDAGSRSAGRRAPSWILAVILLRRARKRKEKKRNEREKQEDKKRTGKKEKKKGKIGERRALPFPIYISCFATVML